MNRDRDTGPLLPQRPTRQNPRADIPRAATQATPKADAPAPWREFGQQVLTAHHRQGLGAQCICGSMMYHCPVIAAAERLGLPTDDPRRSA